MKAILTIGVALVSASVGLGAQDPLSAAKDLHVSAAYEEALSALSSIAQGPTAPETARQVEQYRAFCLYALGRTREAESVAESMIRKEPLLHLDAADASPRIELMFSEVRKRLLPTLIRERFKTARSALDQKNYNEAQPALIEARLMIVEAEKLGVHDEGLGDLSVLVDGFLQLIRSTTEQQAPSRPAVSATTVAPPVAQTLPAPTTAAEPASRRGSAPPPAAPPTAAPRAAAPPASAPRVAATAGGPKVYSIEDTDVAPPVVIDQRMPAMPNEMASMVKSQRVTGLLDVTIDETGNVVDAAIRRSVNVSFDNLFLRSARRWKYRPATKNGVPVRYLKTLALVP